MTELDNVVNGLWCCTHPGTCSHCPFEIKRDGRATYDSSCLQSLLKAARDLLKAQEPRVMTLEEVEEGQAYWLEMRGIASEYAICKMNDHGDSAFLDFSVQHGDKTLESVGYGKRFRCWTSHPTDEQREATPWA